MRVVLLVAALCNLLTCQVQNIGRPDPPAAALSDQDLQGRLPPALEAGGCGAAPSGGELPNSRFARRGGRETKVAFRGEGESLTADGVEQGWEFSRYDRPDLPGPILAGETQGETIVEYTWTPPKLTLPPDDPFWADTRRFASGWIRSIHDVKSKPSRGIAAAAPDDYDPLADTLEKDAKKRFLTADKAYFAEVSRHIDINEGETGEGNARRSCTRQAQLWLSRNVLHMPGAAEAALPGCSLHNYGLAVDVKGVNSSMRKALTDAGWLDDVEGEAWHFSCVSSSAYQTVRKKIGELRSGLAAAWSADAEKAFNLNQRKNTLYKELATRRTRFEGDVQAFNRQAKILNDSRSRFIQQTESFPQRRDEVLSLLAGVDEKTRRLEAVHAQFRSISERVIQALETNLEEIRRLIVMQVEDADRVITPRIASLPAGLRQEYVTAKGEFGRLSTQLKNELAILQKIISGFQSTIGPFERTAVALLEEHRHLTALRKGLEDERGALERGFTELQLMGRETMFLMGRAGQTLENIQSQVDEVSSSLRRTL